VSNMIAGGADALREFEQLLVQRLPGELSGRR
jgi:hypothetical protein